jgi:hypothetical protein
VQAKGIYCSPPLLGTFNIKAGVQTKGKNGRVETRTRGLTDVNPANGNHAYDVILLVVESFNN